MDYQVPKHKTVYAIRVKEGLKKRGYEPLFETNNPSKPGFRAWVYEITPDFLEAFEEIAFGKEGK